MGKTDVGDAEDYLAAFAGSYLLSDQQDDEHDHSGRQGAPIDLVYENSEEPRAGRQQNWNTGTCTGHAAESSELHETYHRGGHMQTGSRDGGTMNKAPTEPVDSSEWDQTQERCGSQQGANLMSNTDSPDSVIFSRVAAGGAPQQAEGPIHRPALEGSEGGGHTDSYSHRSKVDNGAGAGMDAEHMQLSHAPQMRRLSLEGREDKGSWDRRESMGGAMMPPISGFAGQGYHGYPSHAGSETPFRRSEGREAWSSGMTDMHGSLDSSAWGVRMAHRMPPAANLSRMHSDMSGLPLRERLPVMRHSYGDVGEGYDGHGPPRASLEMGASHLEAMYGEPSLQGGPSPQGDARRGHRRSSSNGVGLPQPSPTPRRLAARDFHSPQAPGTPSDATRKRRRGDGYPMLEPSMGQELPGFEGMERMAGRAPRQQQEQLIYSLKQQIEGLDQQTQGLLKDTLYRISRNANAANGVVEPSFRTNQRNAYLDKVVANFMYNRFSPSVAARPAGIPPASRFPTPPYLGRASSSPVPYDTGKQTLHMEP